MFCSVRVVIARLIAPSALFNKRAPTERNYLQNRPKILAVGPRVNVERDLRELMGLIDQFTLQSRDFELQQHPIFGQTLGRLRGRTGNFATITALQKGKVCVPRVSQFRIPCVKRWTL